MFRFSFLLVVLPLLSNCELKKISNSNVTSVSTSQSLISINCVPVSEGETQLDASLSLTVNNNKAVFAKGHVQSFLEPIQRTMNFEGNISKVEIGRYARRVHLDGGIMKGKLKIRTLQGNKEVESVKISHFDYFHWADTSESETAASVVTRDWPRRHVILRYPVAEHFGSFVFSSCTISGDSKVLLAFGVDFNPQEFKSLLSCDLKLSGGQKKTFDERLMWKVSSPENIPYLLAGNEKTTISFARQRLEGGMKVYEYFRFGETKPIRIYMKENGSLHKLVTQQGLVFFPDGNACNPNNELLSHLTKKLTEEHLKFYDTDSMRKPGLFPPVIE